MLPESEFSPAEVFIVYSGTDMLHEMKAIVDDLVSRGVSAWWAEMGIPGGANWEEFVSDVIKNCKVVLLMCTYAGLASSQVVKEVTTAANRRKPLIPLFVEQITERIEDLPRGWDLRLGPAQIIRISDRPTEQWLPHLLDSLKRFGVAISPLPGSKTATGRAPGTSSGKQSSLTRSEFSETEFWLRKFRAVAQKMRAWAAQVKDPNELESVFKRRISAAVDVLANIDDELPDLHCTLVALARYEGVTAQEVAALRQLQGALVDIARAVMQMRREKVEGLDDLQLPPYDLWLPFKGGPAKPSTQSTG
jgi:hypothetical protein